jgi:hypothetical protein
MKMGYRGCNDCPSPKSKSIAWFHALHSAALDIYSSSILTTFAYKMLKICYDTRRLWIPVSPNVTLDKYNT